MKNNAFFAIGLLFLAITSCGDKTKTEPTPNNDSTNVEVDTNSTSEVDLTKYSYEMISPHDGGYGRICAQPIDTFYSVDTVKFLYEGKEMYTEVNADSYIFYNSIGFWPKVLALNNGKVLYS